MLPLIVLLVMVMVLSAAFVVVGGCCFERCCGRHIFVVLGLLLLSLVTPQSHAHNGTLVATTHPCPFLREGSRGVDLGSEQRRQAAGLGNAKGLREPLGAGRAQKGECSACPRRHGVPSTVVGGSKNGATRATIGSSTFRSNNFWLKGLLNRCN